jgi:hypothetical protein
VALWSSMTVRNERRLFDLRPQRTWVTVVFQNPTSPSRLGRDFGRLVRPGLVLAALGLHTGIYRGLVAI